MQIYDIISIMEEELIGIKNNAVALILDSQDLKELERIKLEFLGRSGQLTRAIRKIAKLPEDRRPEIGKLANEVKKTIEQTLDSQKQEVRSKKLDGQQDSIDKTAPGILPKIGHLHPLTQILDEVIDIFAKIGFQVADGPEIEKDYYNFEVLNIPKDHPARDTQQTLYLDTRGSKIKPGEVILRTHGSNMQGRIMEKHILPARVIYPGKVFRYEQVDASHGFEFWQVEGLAIDRNITMTDLFGMFDFVLKEFFGEKSKVRFAAHNFPFTEPSTEVYVTCSVCKGRGCSFCKKTGWVEIAGAGMIHPNLLKNVGIDSKKWQGFAFGFGFSRMITLKYQMDDLRLLTNPDLRILEQF